MKHQIKNFESGTEKNQPIDPVAAAYADWLQARKDWRDMINIEGGEDFSHPLQLEAQGREDAAADIMLQEKPVSMMGFAGLAALAWCFNAPGEPKPEELPELAQSVDCGPILAIWRACTGKDGFPET
ncbi:hypothetical protein [Roseinatronobacter bogoriensis]|uniref:Uncharacterized protein n=1 Tax=Roseinatronobacter bogoriensis subsp. barguzinensis TaxID=441209 RepID=A0A2K8KAL4_9RHOB|nr:hypothetical protein [Rhodobaca]ATX64725.1 hypothetical protein BG454_01825 [Rhodobaca barguzinensis]MBB4209425.1 hypothetical protein [Rhodobaca bogoriensis DSM 18756]TDY66780.1 hypothetical protein EV660_1094 [Rhodobaca bogoriensis DSM 18756]